MDRTVRVKLFSFLYLFLFTQIIFSAQLSEVIVSSDNALTRVVPSVQAQMFRNQINGIYVCYDACTGACVEDVRLSFSQKAKICGGRFLFLSTFSLAAGAIYWLIKLNEVMYETKIK